MINPTDEAYYDPRLSCTIDEAAAKMIGWMQGSIRKKYIKITEHGIPADELPFLHSLSGSLLDELVEQREAAKQALFIAAEIEDGFYKEYEDVEKFSDLYNNAVYFLSAIKLELTKGESSGLVIDKEATDSTGITHLFIASVLQWALERHGITILGLDSLPENNPEPQVLPPVNPVPEQASSQKQVLQKKIFALQDAILAAIVKLGENPEKLPMWKHSKPGVKADVFKYLDENNLCSRRMFDKEWSNLHKDKKIIYVK